MPKKIAIVGPAKSGTSALYSTIKKALPTPRRLVFEPQGPMELTYLTDQEEENALTKLMFTSLRRCKFNPESFTHGVFVVRDPRDILVSSLLFRANRRAVSGKKKVFAAFVASLKKKEKKPGSVPMVAIFDAISPDEKVKMRESVERNLTAYADYIDANKDFITIKYEDLIEDKVSELSEYLDLDVARPERLDGWIKKIDRKGTSGDWKNWICDEDKEHFGPVMEAFIDKFSYDRSWQTNEERQILPRYASEYVRNLAELREADPNRENSEHVSDEALLSAVEDGKPVAMAKLARMVIDDGSALASVDDAYEILFRMGAMGDGEAAVEAGSHFIADSQVRRGMASYRNGMAAKHGPAFFMFGSRLVDKKDEKKVQRGLKALRRGAKLGETRCEDLLNRMGKR